jgi:hypothetical protein
MKRLIEETKKELGVNSGEELKEKLIKEMKELGLSKIDVIYYVISAISTIIVFSIVGTLFLFFFYHIDDFFDNKPIVFNLKTIIQIVAIFVGCFIFFSLYILEGIIDFIFCYRLNRAITFKFLKDLKKYGVIKDIVIDIIKDVKDLKKKDEEK